MDEVPIRPGLEMSSNPFIVKLSLTQFWDCFYANDAPYFGFRKELLEEDGRDTLNYYTDWFAPNETAFETTNGMSVRLVRKADWVTKVEGNPLMDSTSFTGHTLLIDNGNDSFLQLESRVQGYDFTLSDRF